MGQEVARVTRNKRKAVFPEKEGTGHGVIGVMEKKEEQEFEDERREAAIASTPSLQPNFKPKRGITQAQLSKFHVLFTTSQPSPFYFFYLKSFYFLFFIAKI